MRLSYCMLLMLFTVWKASCFPIDDNHSFIVPPIRPKRDTGAYIETGGYAGQPFAQIETMHINTLVRNRYAKTEVTSKVKNAASYAQEIAFSAMIPANAYISKFVMEIDGKTYEGKVIEKEEGDNIYNQAVQSGETSGYVSMSVRDTNQFKISVNVEAGKEVIFKLTYEELLRRKKDLYEVVINIHPGSYIDDLNVQVHINETLPLRFIGSPPLRSGNSLIEDMNLVTRPDIDLSEDYCSARVTFKQSKYDQYQKAQMMKTTGYAVQFVVQYDVERYPTSEPVLTSDGHFVHFFAPSGLLPLPKHMIFVLDTSGSMEGQKINKLKEAMKSILVKMKPEDLFNIVEFSDTARVWNIPGESILNDFRENEMKPDIPVEAPATEENILHAQNVVDSFTADGATNIAAALQTGLLLVPQTRNSGHKIFVPIIIFLTDGLPTVDLTEPSEILNKVNMLNAGPTRAIIFSLAFGDDADEKFLAKLSFLNFAKNGFRHIYEDADANIQLVDFFDEISTPLLTSVQFEYDKEYVSEITETNFPVYYSGSEIVVAGKIDNSKEFTPKVTANGLEHTCEYQAGTKNAGVDLERLYVYLTIKEKFEEMKINPNNAELRQQILDRALKYSYITPVTTMVIGTPNKGTKHVIFEDASKANSQPMPPKQQILEGQLPWLSSILKSDGTVVIKKNSYVLGFGKNVVWEYLCMNSRNHAVGYCRLIDDCTSFAKELESSDQYEEHFCPLNNYAGICCPKGETNVYEYLEENDSTIA